MTTEKHDPWALLREARDFMRQAAISRGPCPDCTECDYRDAIIAKADAALAAHDAVPPSEVEVEWRLANRPHVFLAHLNDADMALRVDWDRWYWKVTREGHTNTLDEAKSAAIAAAKGMR